MTDPALHPHQALIDEAREAARQAHHLSVQDTTKIHDAGILQRCRDALYRAADALEAATEPEPQPDADGRIHAPDLYARLSKPRPGAEAKAAYERFHADVRAARARYGLRDVVLVVATPITTNSDKDGLRLSVGNCGDGALVVPMLAQALGAMRKKAADELDAIARGETP